MHDDGILSLWKIKLYETFKNEDLFWDNWLLQQFWVNSVPLNKDDHYCSRPRLRKLICISTKNITVLAWFYFESFAFFVALYQKICVALHVYEELLYMCGNRINLVYDSGFIFAFRLK